MNKTADKLTGAHESLEVPSFVIEKSDVGYSIVGFYSKTFVSEWLNSSKLAFTSIFFM